MKRYKVILTESELRKLKNTINLDIIGKKIFKLINKEGKIEAVESGMNGDFEDIIINLTDNISVVMAITAKNKNIVAKVDDYYDGWNYIDYDDYHISSDLSDDDIASYFARKISKDSDYIIKQKKLMNQRGF
jgi:hypothetical protein